MTARAIDTQRLSTLAHEYERGMMRLVHDLMTAPVESGMAHTAEQVLQELGKPPFEQTGIGASGNLVARIGRGRHTILLDTRAGALGAAGTAAALYAGKLIHELGMYDDYTLWIAHSGEQQAWRELRPECAVFAEPTKLCIEMREASTEGFLSESHPLAEAAIATYETLFELPPIVAQVPSPTGPFGVPAIAFGAGSERVESTMRAHLLKAAQFYAVFPTIYVETRKHR